MRDQALTLRQKTSSTLQENVTTCKGWEYNAGSPKATARETIRGRNAGFRTRFGF
jgi:hypothetical protein